MAKPLALDLFCCQGGASAGLVAAGFDVVGIDIKPQPRYPFQFIQGDALNPPVDLSRFDLIWASPLCQKHTPLRGMWNGREKRGLTPHQDMIPAVRELLIRSGKPYVIENVIGAPLHATIMLCGTMFGLRTKGGAQLQRHRLFETSFMVLQPSCSHHGSTLIVAGTSMSGKTRLKREVISITGKQAQRAVEYNLVRELYSADDARDAMQMPWATIAGLSQAIPPAYAEFIGRAALAS